MNTTTPVEEEVAISARAVVGLIERDSVDYGIVDDGIDLREEPRLLDDQQPAEGGKALRDFVQLARRVQGSSSLKVAEILEIIGCTDDPDAKIDLEHLRNVICRMERLVETVEDLFAICEDAELVSESLRGGETGPKVRSMARESWTVVAVDARDLVLASERSLVPQGLAEPKDHPGLAGKSEQISQQRQDRRKRADRLADRLRDRRGTAHA